MPLSNSRKSTNCSSLFPLAGTTMGKAPAFDNPCDGDALGVVDHIPEGLKLSSDPDCSAQSARRNSVSLFSLEATVF